MNANPMNKMKTGLAAAILLASTAVTLPASAAGLKLGLGSSDSAEVTVDGYKNDSIYNQLNTADDHRHFGDSTGDANGLFSLSGNNGSRPTVRLSNPRLYWE